MKRKSGSLSIVTVLSDGDSRLTDVAAIVVATKNIARVKVKTNKTAMLLILPLENTHYPPTISIKRASFKPGSHAPTGLIDAIYIINPEDNRRIRGRNLES